MPITRKLDRDTVNAIRSNADGHDRKFITARFSKLTRLGDRASPDRWQCRAIDMCADDGKSATVTITVDGTTGGVVSLIWDKPTNRWELPGSAPDDWASRGLLQISSAELAVVAKVAVEFANWV